MEEKIHNKFENKAIIIGDSFSKYLYLPQLAKSLIYMMEYESDIKNTSYILMKLWNEFKKNKCLIPNLKKENILLSLLIKILEDKMSKFASNKNFILLLILAYVEGMKFDYGLFHAKLDKIIENDKSAKLNILDFTTELLKNEGFEKESKLCISKFNHKKLKPCSIFESFFVISNILKVPTCWKLNEL